MSRLNRGLTNFSLERLCSFKVTTHTVTASSPRYSSQYSLKLSDPSKCQGTWAPKRDSLKNMRTYATAVASKGLQDLNERLKNELNTIKGAGLFKKERIITSPQSVHVRVEGYGADMLNFCANNYLGLSNHPEVVKAGKAGLDQFGAGLSSVRFICGTQSLHKDLEKKLSEFHGREDTILYASCFDANAGLFEVLCSSPDDAIISDELNHASIIDGIRLAKTKKFRYAHRDMKDLEEKLKEAENARTKIIVTDGVFSMDGNVAPLPEIIELARKYGALTFIDECHATGFFGKTGRGTEEYFDLPLGSIDILNSTLGKALGGASGGYTTASKEICEMLRQRSRPYLFSNALPPPVVSCAIKVVDMLMESSDLVKKVQSGTTQFRNGLKKMGFDVIGDPSHPICPVMLKDAKLTSKFAEKMQERGIYVVGFSYPVVPKEKARIRVQISAAHTKDDITRALSAFESIGKELNVI
ncbi:2-amino-3-ketobutyrate coenzyme A ligase, mitochondrial [Ischnura elegans]|uniref:2-amino-3-ketobutyrate coenzyme A ligase, mitochondrial n=1 Tax=Ischnura elegans TaxID=197161 RepID=UPI001ED87A5F|nr:2-amino-3-ketobutyrate coenzyme A ligase, mitochondrial [Ischnura elegans]